MKCPLCNREIPTESQLIDPYEVFCPSIKEHPEGGQMRICGQCFLLVNILDTLKEIKDGKLR